jgi:hypothetical protein
MAAGFLRNRKAQIDAASNYADGGVVTEEKKPPTMLGSGLVAGAAKTLMSRKAQIDAASNYKDGGMVKGYANGGMVKDYMDGGMVKGPGTGTSDSIKAMVPVGSYVMPADSTRKMVNLSNGEMVIPPEQTKAMGVGLLDRVRAATHKNGAKKSDGMNYQVGGVVDEDLLRRQPTIPGMTAVERPASPADMRQFARDAGPGNPRVVAGSSPEAEAFRQSQTPRGNFQPSGPVANAPTAINDVVKPAAKPGLPSRIGAGLARVGSAAVLGDALGGSMAEDSTARYAQRFGFDEPTGDGSIGDVAKFATLRGGVFVGATVQRLVVSAELVS